MKTLLSVVILLVMWSLPAPVLGGSNQVDLTGKGTSHLDQSGKDTLSTGRKVHNIHSAQQGQKAFDATMKQKAKNDAEMKRIFNNMNKNR